jgi:molybdopterin synthase sulfur carrier subunit
MELELRTFATFREAVGAKDTTHSHPGESATVEAVLRELEEEYDGLAGQLIEDGELRPQINVLKNGREVLHIDGLDTELADGDTLSIFPPVAGGDDGGSVAERGENSESTADGSESTTDSSESRRVERSFRGISVRLARRYLENLGGTAVDDETVEADGWAASLSADTVSVGPSLQLTEVTVVFEADSEFDLSSLIEQFAQKAMRAGG